MQRARLSRGLMMLLILDLIGFNKMELKADYDDTYVLAITQKYAIPENVSAGDYVGYWKKTYTWMSDGTISYSIEKNYYDAFLINSSSGLITVNDASHINGNIKQQDTIINLIIRTTDAVKGDELDTAQIWIKENAYCKFYDFAGTGTGNRTDPYNDLDDIAFQTGYAYFLKRGTHTHQQSITLEAFRTTSAHPTIFAAYGIGSKPTFIGDGVDMGCFWIGDAYPYGNATAQRSEHIYLYDLIIRDYGNYAIKMPGESRFIGSYNCEFYKDDSYSHEATIVLATAEDNDNYIYRPTEFINCVLDTCNTNFIKCNVGPLSVTNCSINHVNNGSGGGGGIRIDNGRKSILKHNLLQNISFRAIQIRSDSNTVEDCRIINSSYDAIICEGNTPITNGPDHIVIKNCYIKNTTVRAIALWKGTNDYAPFHNYTIEDNYIDGGGGDVGIRISIGDDIKIRRNLITGFVAYGGIRINDHLGATEANNIKICDNVFYGNTIDITALNGSGNLIYNNTSDGRIDLTGTNGAIVKNNYFKSLTDASLTSNNIDIDTIKTEDHFINYVNHDYRLKATALSSIDKGANVSITNDYIGTLIQGNAPDIGAYEFIKDDSLEINNPPSIEDEEFRVKEENFINNYVGQIIAKDDDPEQILTYSIIMGNESDIFTIDSATGIILTIKNDIFSLPVLEYTLTVKVEDNAPVKKSNTANASIVFEKESFIVYIDPENQDDILEDGSPEHPFNSWQDIVWENGHSYLQKRGTSSSEPKISIYATDVILGAYGEGERPIIQSEAEESAIKAFEKSNMTIQDVHIIAEKAISCIYVSGTTSENVIIENCVLEAAENGVRVIDGVSIILRYNTISNCSYAVYSYAESNKIYYNIFKNNLNAINITSSLSSSEIYNNVFYENSMGVANSYSDLKLFNNIFYLVAVGDVAINQQIDSLLSDNNIFFPEQDGFIAIGDNSFSTLGDYQDKKGLDLNSFSNDPQFVDVYNDNFTLNDSSPAIDAGIIVGVDKDFIGNLVPYGGAPDIGIIEKSSNDPSEIFNQPSESKVDKNSMIIFPNPSDGRFSISVKNINQQDANLYVNDITGKTILEKKCHAQDNSFLQSINISEFPTGVYMILLKAANTIYSQRILKTY